VRNSVVSVRIPPEIEQAVEAESAARAVTVSELVREALIAKYGKNTNGRLEQVLYEVVRTRLSLQHYIDHAESAEFTDALREAAARDAQRYVARLRGE
jgi:hypothetical protein